MCQTDKERREGSKGGRLGEFSSNLHVYEDDHRALGQCFTNIDTKKGFSAQYTQFPRDPVSQRNVVAKEVGEKKK